MVDIPTVPVTDDEEEDRFETLALEFLALHHDVLLGCLQDLAGGVYRNLMVLMPPGSAKSTYVDVVFVPWFMAREKRRNVIMTSYGSDLARKQGRRARQLVRSRSFTNLFPDVTVSADSSAADEWSLTNGSEYMAGGILSGVTGNRADLLVVDDPVKGREEAESETIRKKTREAFDDDLQTRLKPGGRTIIIQTRWHADDLAGGILPEQWSGESGLIRCRDGQDWYVLAIQAKATTNKDPLGRKPGEYLWPEWFGPDHWAKFEQNQRTWSSLFQQKPSPEEGTYFQRDWFQRHPPMDVATAANRGLNVYITSDYAVSEDGGDFTEHGVWGFGSDNILYQLDWWHGQTSSDQWVESLLDLVQRWKPLCYFGEQGTIEKATRPMISRSMTERQIYCRMEWIPSIVKKTIRARPFQARAAMNQLKNLPGNVSLLSDDRGERVLNQMLQFPAGKYDDAVDTASLMGLVIDEAHPGIVMPASSSGGKPNDYGSAPSGGASWRL
jgi:hypothetical protein